MIRAIKNKLGMSAPSEENNANIQSDKQDIPVKDTVSKARHNHKRQATHREEKDTDNKKTKKRAPLQVSAVTNDVSKMITDRSRTVLQPKGGKRAGGHNSQPAPKQSVPKHAHASNAPRIQVYEEEEEEEEEAEVVEEEGMEIIVESDSALMAAPLIPTHSENSVVLANVDGEWKDIDHEFQRLSMCAEYAQDIFLNLLEREEAYRPIRTDYMKTVQTEITEKMRAILMEWMIEVTGEYQLNSDTLFFARNYTDRVLARTVVAKRKLQLVGTVALLIASKIEMVQAPSVNEFIYVCDNAYTRDEVLLTEGFLLKVLKYELLPPTEKQFLRRFAKAAAVDIEDDEAHVVALTHLSSFLCELSILEYSFIGYRPSIVALAAICISLITLGLPFWTPTLAHYSHVTKDNPELKACAKDLHRIFAESKENNYRAVMEKYQATCYSQVSQLPVPVIENGQWPNN